MTLVLFCNISLMHLIVFFFFAVLLFNSFVERTDYTPQQILFVSGCFYELAVVREPD